MSRKLAERTKKLRDDAIVSEALNHRVYASTDKYAQDLPAAINRWNSTAAWLEKLFGSFGLRLEQTGAASFKFKPASPAAWNHALGMLWKLCGERPLPNHRKMADLEWMFSWLMLGAMPQNKINWEATARQGAWNTRLRKTKAGIAAQQNAVLRENMLNLKQDQEHQHRRHMGIGIKCLPELGSYGGIPEIEWRRLHRPDKPRPALPVTSAGTVFPPATDDPE